MSDTENPTEDFMVGDPLPPPPQDPALEYIMTLDEFCINYRTAAEVETLMAFRARERVELREDDTPSNYLSRLAAFKQEQH